MKSPAELVAGVLKQTGEFSSPRPGIHEFAKSSLDSDGNEGTMTIMGQSLMNPPTVEGWHTGHGVDRFRDSQRENRLCGTAIRRCLQTWDKRNYLQSGQPGGRSFKDS